MTRAYQRAAAPGVRSDRVAIERHLRKLDRSHAARRAYIDDRHPEFGTQILQKRNKRGQLVSDVYTRVKFGPSTEIVTGISDLTGEIREFVLPRRRRRGRRVGFYHGGSGWVGVNDGRVAGDDIARVLGAKPAFIRENFELQA